MAKLFIALLIIAALVVVATMAARGANAVRQVAVQSTREAQLPDTVKTISYVLLIALMFGVVTGWFGGL